MRSDPEYAGLGIMVIAVAPRILWAVYATGVIRLYIVISRGQCFGTHGGGV